MDGIVYKSSIFDRLLYSLLAVCILVPGTCIMLYGISRRDYDWPMIIVGALICSIVIYILQKYFTYRVTVYDEYLEIRMFDAVRRVRYGDIIELREKRNALYIIDWVDHDGRRVIRGADADACNDKDSVEIDITKVLSLQRAYIGDYDDLIDRLYEKCGKTRKRRRVVWSRASFISAASLKTDNGIRDILEILAPYGLLMVIFLMCLAEFVVASRGTSSAVITVYLRLIFPIFVVITLFILTLKYMDYIKKLLRDDSGSKKIPAANIRVFLIMSIGMSAGIIILFFIILNMWHS